MTTTPDPARPAEPFASEEEARAWLFSPAAEEFIDDNNLWGNLDTPDTETDDAVNAAVAAVRPDDPAPWVQVGGHGGFYRLRADPHRWEVRTVGGDRNAFELVRLDIGTTRPLAPSSLYQALDHALDLIGAE